MQSEHASVGDLGATQDQLVEASVIFQWLKTGIANSLVLEPENLEAASHTKELMEPPQSFDPIITDLAVVDG